MALSTSSAVRVEYLRCEYHINPLGIDVRRPRLSWQLAGPGRNVVQTAYRIQAAGSAEALSGGQELLWDSGRIAAGESLHHPYAGPPLSSGQRVYWRVCVWDGLGQASAWSVPAWWEMGLLHTGDWRAKWIEVPWEEDPSLRHPAPYLRTAFEVDGRVARARAYVTAHGLYELHLNGAVVGDQLFTPGFTAYPKRLQYQSYEVTDLLVEGANAVGAILGDGWWRGKVGADSVRNAYGTRLALLAQIHIVYTDGREAWVVSDGDWKAVTGPIIRADLKDGEVYHAQLELPGWDRPEYDDVAWQRVRVANIPLSNLVAPLGPPVRRREEFRPVAILHTPAGETVVDLGQNIAGRVRMRVQGPAGALVTLQHGEALDKEGNFNMAHLQMPIPGLDPLLQEDRYTLKGEGVEVYEPRFTFHGFRYIKVTGYPGTPTPDDFTGLAIYSDMPVTGHFACSNPAINQLQHNIEWSEKGNFLDIPTDCPQRERAGWTGDAQLFADTGSFVMDTAAFFTKWLRDLAAEQHPNGMVSNLVPDTFKFSTNKMMQGLEGSAGWGDAAVIIPWTIYLVYGDRRILEEQYASMAAWVEYMATAAQTSHWTKRLMPPTGEAKARQPYIWDTGYHWGEWLEPGSKGPKVMLEIWQSRIFSRPVVATAYFAYSCGLLAEAAQVLGKRADALRYRDLAAKVREAYAAEFIGADGRIQPDRQASYVRVLAFDLAPEAMRPVIARRLVDLVRAKGYHLDTGFLSTPFLCHVLSRYGYLDVAYALLQQTTVPSWLYPISKGATTIWETWDAIAPDGSLFGSMNHYAYGAIGSWLYQVVAGLQIDPEQPGYRHFRVQPQPGGGLTHARVTYQSVQGEIVAGWVRSANAAALEVMAPPNTSATVRLPHAVAGQVTEGGHALADAEGIRYVQQAGDTVEVEIGSGRYLFAWPWE